jgi:hypothetical protein
VRTPRPIYFPDPVVSRADLYDRASAVADVLDSLRHRTTIVLGGRLIGKTSLLNVVEQLAAKQGGLALIRLASADSRSDFMAEILDGIRDWVDDHRRNSQRMRAQEPSAGTVAQLCKRIATLAGRVTGVVFVVCIEEFDSLVENMDKHEARLVLDLIGHLDMMPTLPVRFLLTMSAIPRLVITSYSSSIINKSRIVFLRPWDAEEAARFAEWLADGRFIFDEAAVTALFEAAGGHPYFTKAVLSALIADLPATPGVRCITAQRIAAAVQHVVSSSEVGITLQNLVSAHLSAAAVAVLDRAGSSPAGMTARNVADMPDAGRILGALRDDGLMRQQGDRHLLRLGLWREWRAVTRSVERRPPLVRRIALAARRVRLRRATSGALFGVVALPLLFATAYLAIQKTVVLLPCGASTGPLAVDATYPAFASPGDHQQFRLLFRNCGNKTLRGYAFVSFPRGLALTQSQNGIPISLGPQAQHPADVDFTTTASAGWLIWPVAPVGVKVTISVDGARRTLHWSIGVAPVPRLQAIQHVAASVFALFLVPLLVHVLAPRIFSAERRPRPRACAANGD